MSSTRENLVSGIFYTAIAKYSGVIISLVVTAILSRILTADDFGVVAIATIIIAFFAMFSDMGIAPAIIQNKELIKEDLNNIFSFTIWSGLTIMAIFFGLSWVIASYYHSEVLIPICQLLSINLLFSSINIVPNALLQKDKRFKFIGIRSLSIQLICGVASVIAALCGAGLYALLVNPVVSSIVLFFINYSQYRLKWSFTLGLSSIKIIFSYSAYQLGFNIINYFSRNLDKLLMGRHLGMSELGYYEKSYRLMMYPLQLIPNVVSPVMHPIFSDLQNDLKQLSKSYLEVVKILAFIGFPLSIYLLFSSSEWILLIFGNQWGPSVPVFAILSLTVSFQIIMSTSGAIFQAANSTKALFWCGVITTAINVIAICIGLWQFKSIQGVSWCIAISFTINFILTYGILYYRVLKLSWGPFWKQLIRPIILSALISIPLGATSYFLDGTLPLIITLLLKSVITVIIWYCFVQYTGAININRIIVNIFNKIRKTK